MEQRKLLKGSTIIRCKNKNTRYAGSPIPEMQANITASCWNGNQVYLAAWMFLQIFIQSAWAKITSVEKNKKQAERERVTKRSQSRAKRKWSEAV